MKNLKKTVSIIGALAMSMSMLGSMTAVQAEDAEIYGWARNTANTETAMANVVETGTIDGNTVTPASGSKMLEMKAGATEEEIVYVPTKLQAGTYTISFKVNYKQNASVHWAAAATMGYKGFGSDINEGAFARLTSEPLEGGWLKYSGTITLNSADDGVWNGKTNNFVIKFKTAKNTNKIMYIDDVSVQDENYNEYVTNGGFELDAPVVEPTPEPDTITENIVGWARSKENTEATASNVVTTGTLSNGTTVTPTGSHMLEIKTGPKGTANEEHYVYATNKLPAGEYTITFDVIDPNMVSWVGYAKLGTKTLGSDANGKFARIGDTADHPGKKEVLSNGWTRFSQTFTVLNETDGVWANQTNNAIIGISNPDAKGKVMYIDNVSVKDANNVEYVTNGDFEQVDPLAFSDYTLTIGGSAVTNVTDGDATAKVTVKNNQAADMNAQIIVASYSSDNGLIDMRVSDVTNIAAGDTTVVYTTAPLTVDNNTAKVKVFLWDSLGDMTPLKDMQEYTR